MCSGIRQYHCALCTHLYLCTSLHLHGQKKLEHFANKHGFSALLGGGIKNRANRSNIWEIVFRVLYEKAVACAEQTQRCLGAEKHKHRSLGLWKGAHQPAQNLVPDGPEIGIWGLLLARGDLRVPYMH